MKKYNKDIYKMYEEEYNKRVALNNEVRVLKLEISNLKYELNKAMTNNNNKINAALEKTTKPLIEKKRFITK
jgi:hypothetical protein